MKQLIHGILGLLCLAGVGGVGAETVPAETASATVEGVWINAAGDGYIEIRREGGTLHGTIIGGPGDPDRRDMKNPDPKLRERRLVGTRILEDFEADGPGKWAGGTIYDPNNGKTYACTLQLEGTDTLKVRGYIGVSLFGRTERWTRRRDGA